MNYYADSNSNQYIKLSKFNWKNHLKQGLQIKNGYNNNDFLPEYSNSLKNIGECLYDTIKCKYFVQIYFLPGVSDQNLIK